MKHTRPARLLWIAVLLSSCFLAAGCMQFAGWFVNAFAPPQKVKAIYKLPVGKKVLVFVEDLTSPVNYEPIKAKLTESLNRRLIEHKVAGSVVPYENLLTLMTATPNFNELHINEVGQKLEANLVLYVRVDSFSLKEQASPLWHGRLASTVKVVDVKEGRLWPKDRPEGYPVKMVEIPVSRPVEDYQEQLSDALADRMSDQIAKLFYAYQVSVQEAVRQEQDSKQGPTEDNQPNL